MRFQELLACTAMVSLLSSCGGDSVASTPAPPSSPTPTTNATLTDLQYSQSFQNDAAAIGASWDLTTKTGISSSAKSAKLNIAYDAQTNGYTISTDGYSQTFLPADQISSDDYDTKYAKDNAYLTLTSKGYAAGLVTKYVRGGLLQHNSVNGSTQNTDLTSFTYGLPTNATATPRTGSAAFATEAFGAVTAPGEEPKSFQGAGQIDIDFALGVFRGHSYLTEYSLVGEGNTSGGGIELTTVGQLSSDGAGLSGTAIYGGWDGEVATDLTGSLYGPSGQELGATFSGQNADGMSVTGSIVGQRDSTLTPANLSFANMTQEQTFYTRMSQYAGGILTWQNSETFLYSGYSSAESGGQFTIADKVDGRPNFTTYQKTFPNDYYGTQDVTLELYKTGSSNSELALTYASFGQWQGSLPASYNGPASHWFIYGFATPNSALASRTGSASYEGVAYARGTGSAGERYDVSGTSRLAVDFGSDTFTGALALTGRDTTTDAAADFGSTAFSGTLNNRSSTLTGDFSAGGALGSAIYGQFFGPSGQELAGTFVFNVPEGAAAAGTNINGVFAATRN
ncbi:transferrin-binding protein-like solute binding protein [Altericroceibacterium xinjiangense]|uniref:transferrin-binding protein-like solute binding protein n=1 Tax=Altericroceibacterium xinjiangense TaxID=762261 RepID=UPI000F7DCDB8|nr:transferrin-binding protein-like solute binding protein [Altericroceibacterium xinjiangense]